MAAERIEPPARPSFGGVLAQVWAIVRARWPVLLLAAAVIFIPAGLLEAVDHELQQPLAEAEELTSLEVVEIVVAVFVIAATALLGDVLYAGVVAALLTAEREGRELRLRERLAGLPVARLVAADLALALVVVIGLLLLILPAFVFLTWFALVAPVVKVERLPLRAAFRRSRELVRGRFWLVFWLVVPITLGSEALSALAQSGAVDVIGDGFVADWVGAVLAELVTAPPFALAVVVLYFELSSLRTSRSACGVRAVDRIDVALRSAPAPPASDHVRRTTPGVARGSGAAGCCARAGGRCCRTQRCSRAPRPRPSPGTRGCCA